MVDFLKRFNDPASLRRLVKDWLHLMRFRAGDPALRWQPDWEHSRARVHSLVADIASEQGMNMEAKELQELAEISSDLSIDPSVPASPDFARQAPVHLGWKSHVYQSVASPAELAPGRLAEYALADRFAALVGLILASAALLLAGLEAARRGRPRNAMADAVMPLLRFSDRAWLLFLGLAAPLGWCWLVRLTPLGGRDTHIAFFSDRNGIPLCQPWLTQTMATVVLSLVLLFQATRWRWAKRGGCLALRPARLWPGWGAAVLLAVVVPAIGAIRFLTNHHDRFTFAVSAAGASALLWLLWQVFAIWSAPAEGALPGVLWCRTLIPVLTLGGLLALCATFHFRHSERAWVATRQPLQPGPGGPLAQRSRAAPHRHPPRAPAQGVRTVSTFSGNGRRTLPHRPLNKPSSSEAPAQTQDDKPQD